MILDLPVLAVQRGYSEFQIDNLILQLQNLFFQLLLFFCYIQLKSCSAL